MKIIKKVIRVLKMFSIEKPWWGVTELSCKLNLPKSTIYRILHSLEEEGFLIQDLKNNKYSLWLKFFELGSIVMGSMELHEKARPVLRELVKATDETVHLTVLNGTEVIYIDKIESTRPFQMYSKLGRRAPAYCTGVGKALLAYLPDKDIDELFKDKKLIAYTKNTITDLDKLKEELKTIRNRGYAIDNEEINYGLKCVAAPIKNYTGRTIASISISGSPEDFNQKGISSIAKLVKEAAKKISLSLGYNDKYNHLYS